MTFKAKLAGFIAAGAGFPLFGLAVWLSGGYKKLDRYVNDNRHVQSM